MTDHRTARKPLGQPAGPESLNGCTMLSRLHIQVLSHAPFLTFHYPHGVWPVVSPSHSAALGLPGSCGPGCPQEQSPPHSVPWQGLQGGGEEWQQQDLH